MTQKDHPVFPKYVVKYLYLTTNIFPNLLSSFSETQDFSNFLDSLTTTKALTLVRILVYRLSFLKKTCLMTYFGKAAERQRVILSQPI